MNHTNFSSKLTPYAEQVRLRDYADRAAKLGEPKSTTATPARRRRNLFLGMVASLLIGALVGYLL